MPSGLIARQIYWPAVSADITTYAAECDACLKNSVVKNQPHFQTTLPGEHGKQWLQMGLKDVYIF